MRRVKELLVLCFFLDLFRLTVFYFSRSYDLVFFWKVSGGYFSLHFGSCCCNISDFGNSFSLVNMILCSILFRQGAFALIWGLTIHLLPTIGVCSGTIAVFSDLIVLLKVGILYLFFGM